MEALIPVTRLQSKDPAVQNRESQTLPEKEENVREKNLTKSLTRGMGFLLRMSGMLSIMISPPPGLEKRHTKVRQHRSRRRGVGKERET